MTTICVPYHSPAWESYIAAGWITLYVEGLWATLGRQEEQR